MHFVNNMICDICITENACKIKINLQCKNNQSPIIIVHKIYHNMLGVLSQFIKHDNISSVDTNSWNNYINNIVLFVQ